MSRKVVFLFFVGLLVVGVVLVGLYVVFGGGSREGGGRLLNVVRGEEKVLRVAGSSMEPTIPGGSVVFYKEESFGSLRVGDIIVFQDPGREGVMVVSRIVAVNDDGSLTVKADARSEQYPMHIREDVYVGVVVV